LADQHPSEQPSAVRARVRLLAVLLPLAALVALDLGLRACGALPPDAPLLFHARTHGPDFSPFVTAEDGTVTIRPDWVSRGDGLRGTVGIRKGRQFLYPGFRPVRLERPKPPGTRRIFVLGGSSAFGLYVGAQAAFPAVLEHRLAERRPAQRWQVVNLGCAGWASDRVANVLPAVLALEPDLVGPGSGLGAAGRLRARLLQASALFAWLDHAVSSTLRSAETRALREEVAAAEAGRIATYEPRAVAAEERSVPDEGFFRGAERSYAANLRRLASLSREASVPLLLVLPVANLVSAPSLSAHAPGFDRAADFMTAMEEASVLQAQGRHEEASARLARAALLSPRHARAHYQLGLELLRAGRRGEGEAALQRASDLDVRTHRITAGLEGVFLNVAAEQGLAWVDLRPVLRPDLDEALAAELFVDHVHPTVAGHQRIAEALLPSVLELLADAPGAARGQRDPSANSM
jgi:tetratricopeptide (TPR) repeat protein